MEDNDIRERTERMISKAKEISEVLLSFSGKFRIISHYDCDGITSASIITKALLREGKDIRLSFVKQLNDDIIEDIGKEENRFIIILDCGSGQLEGIQNHIMNKECMVLICDHHQVQGEIISDNILHLNPIDFGIEENISAAGVSYILSRAMNQDNMELSELAIIGAIGDAQVGSLGMDWGFSGLNKEILKDSQKAKKINVTKGLRLWGRNSRPVHKALEYSFDPLIPGISGSESASIQFLKDMSIEPKKGSKWRTLSELSQQEQKKLASGIIMERIRGDVENPDWIFGDVYDLLDKEKFSDANEFATLLNATGKLEKPFLGLGLCLNDTKSFLEISNILESYRREIGKGVGWVNRNRNKFKETDNAYYMLAGNKISEHFISNVLSIVSRSNIFTKKPSFAFVDADDGKTKISSRASDKNVEGGVNLSEIVSEAAESSGGHGGGHKGAAGATIPKGQEEEFIKLAENKLILLKQKTKSRSEYEEGNKPKAYALNNIEKSLEAAEAIGIKEKYGRREESGTERGKTDKKMERKGLVRYFSA